MSTIDLVQQKVAVLPKEIQELVRDRKLSMGHARALLASDNPLPLAQRVLKEGLSVREVEALVKSQASGDAEPRVPKNAAKDADTKMLEQELSASTGMKIVIDHKPSGAGMVKISYRGNILIVCEGNLINFLLNLTVTYRNILLFGNYLHEKGTFDLFLCLAPVALLHSFEGNAYFF